MGVVSDLIASDGGKLEFGDFSLDSKTKKDGFEFAGDIYKVKTFSEITRLEKNGVFAYESVPGTAVYGFTYTDNGVEFTVEASTDADITLGLDENKEYEIFINGESSGKMSTNLGGKLTLSVEISDAPVSVKVVG